MNVKEAVAAAKQYIISIYSDEELSNLGLEETEFDVSHNEWRITLGFSRPWNSTRTTSQRLSDSAQGYTPQKRSFKVVTIDKNGVILSMKNRVFEEAAE